MSRTIHEQIESLRKISVCDVSDALLKLEKPQPGQAAKAGYLADIVPFVSSVNGAKIIARASTLKLIDKTDPIEPLAANDPHAVPKGSHWADETEGDTILVIEQPATQTCAAVGGIMAARMKAKGLHACVVSGRVRDLAELKETGLPIWAHGKSTVGAGAESKVHAQNVVVSINDVAVSPGDIIFCDPVEGVVAIPAHLVDQVIDLTPKLIAADEKVKVDVERGSTVAEAFRKHRS